jgi:hypothetical protein
MCSDILWKQKLPQIPLWIFNDKIFPYPLNWGTGSHFGASLRQAWAWKPIQFTKERKGLTEAKLGHAAVLAWNILGPISHHNKKEVE